MSETSESKPTYLGNNPQEIEANNPLIVSANTNNEWTIFKNPDAWTATRTEVENNSFVGDYLYIYNFIDYDGTTMFHNGFNFYFVDSDTQEKISTDNLKNYLQKDTIEVYAVAHLGKSQFDNDKGFILRVSENNKWIHFKKTGNITDIGDFTGLNEYYGVFDKENFNDLINSFEWRNDRYYFSMQFGVVRTTIDTTIFTINGLYPTDNGNLYLNQVSDSELLSEIKYDLKLDSVPIITWDGFINNITGNYLNFEKVGYIGFSDYTDTDSGTACLGYIGTLDLSNMGILISTVEAEMFKLYNVVDAKIINSGNGSLAHYKLEDYLINNDFRLFDMLQTIDNAGEGFIIITDFDYICNEFGIV